MHQPINTVQLYPYIHRSSIFILVQRALLLRHTTNTWSKSRKRNFWKVLISKLPWWLLWKRRNNPGKVLREVFSSLAAKNLIWQNWQKPLLQCWAIWCRNTITSKSVSVSWETKKWLLLLGPGSDDNPSSHTNIKGTEIFQLILKVLAQRYPLELWIHHSLPSLKTLFNWVNK